MAKKEATKKAAKKAKVETKTKVEEIEKVAAEPATEQVNETLDVMNGDPAVLSEPEVDEPSEIESEVDEPAIDEPEDSEPEAVEEAAPIVTEQVAAQQEEIKPKKNVLKRMFGYLWNGQEMDY